MHCIYVNRWKYIIYGNLQTDIKYIHALFQADRDGDGLINPDEFYRVMRKSLHPMWRMRPMEMYGDYLGRTGLNISFCTQLPLYGIHLLGFMAVCDSARLRRNHLSFSRPNFFSDVRLSVWETLFFSSPRRGTNPLDDWDSDEDWADQVRRRTLSTGWMIGWVEMSKCNWNGSLDLFKCIYPLFTLLIWIANCHGRDFLVASETAEIWTKNDCSSSRPQV